MSRDTTYEIRYQTYTFGEGKKPKCFYCGAPATCLDHSPPLSRVSDYEALKMTIPEYLKVPCCGECNLLLGDSLQDNLQSRHEHLKALLTARYTHDVIKLDGSRNHKRVSYVEGIKSWLLSQNNLCKHCGKAIGKTTRKHAAFCSSACRSKWHYANVIKPALTAYKLTLKP